MPPMLWPRPGGPSMALLKRPWVSHALWLLCSNLSVQQSAVHEARACCAAHATGPCDDLDGSAGNHYSVVNNQIANAKRFTTPITKTLKPALDYAW